MTQQPSMIHVIRGLDVYRMDDGRVQIEGQEPMPITSAAIFLKMEAEYLNQIL